MVEKLQMLNIVLLRSSNLLRSSKPHASRFKIQNQTIKMQQKPLPMPWWLNPMIVEWHVGNETPHAASQNKRKNNHKKKVVKKKDYTYSSRFSNPYPPIPSVAP